MALVDVTSGETHQKRPEGENQHLAGLAAYFTSPNARPQQSEQERDTDGTKSGSSSRRRDGEADDDERAPRITWTRQFRDHSRTFQQASHGIWKWR